MEPKMTVLFIGKKSRTTKLDLLPIYLRATIEGKRFEAATHHHVKPSEWEPSAGRVKGKSRSAKEKNMALDLIKKQVYDYKQQILFEERDFTEILYVKNGSVRTVTRGPCSVCSGRASLNWRNYFMAQRGPGKRLYPFAVDR